MRKIPKPSREQVSDGVFALGLGGISAGGFVIHLALGCALFGVGLCILGWLLRPTGGEG